MQHIQQRSNNLLQVEEVSGLRRLEKQISSFERMFEGIALVLNPEQSPAR